MARVVTIASGRQVTLGKYVRAIQTAKANPDRMFREGLTTQDPCTGADIVRQFYDGLQDRINQGIPWIDRGRTPHIPSPPTRRQLPSYQNSLWRDSRRIRDIINNRLRVYQFETDEARTRFDHLLATLEN